MLDSGGFAKGVESTLEFCAIVSAYAEGGPKDLKNLFMHGTCNSCTGFVWDGCNHYKFAKAANSN